MDAWEEAIQTEGNFWTPAISGSAWNYNV